VPDDQVAYDRAWHVVTAHIALPSSATADDSFGTLAAGSQQRSSSGRRDAAASEKDFHDAFALLVNPASLLPRATRTDDILSWHVRQVRAHYTQHVIPLLAGCVGDGPEDGEEPGGGRWPAGKKGNYYERHMVIVMSSIRTLEAALRLYFYGLNQLLSGFASLADVSPEVAQDAELLNTRFRRDLHALVSNSASEGLMRSVKAVLVRLAGTILGVPSQEESGISRGQARPAVPGPDDLKVQAARERLMELVRQLHNVGLAGERFQILFAHVMDAMMSAFVTGAYAGLWSAPETGSFGAAMDSVSQGTSLSVASPCIMSLNDWVENHFARLSFEVLACISPNPQGHLPVSLADLKTYQSLALGRLAAMRIQELFDIVLAWPASRPALDDLRATITTPARRRQLTDSFSRALQKRLLHPGCSTLEILQTYISIIRTLHALDPSRVILSNVEQGLHMYLCQREDSIRAVVSGLLASPEEMRAARKVMEVWKQQRDKSRQDETSQTKQRGKDLDPFTSADQDRARETVDHPTTPSNQPHPHRRPTKLVELALLLNDPSQQRRQSRHTPSSTTPTATDADTSLDWNDPTWLPDPIDAGAGYRHRAAHNSEDVIGTLIAALGSGDTFIKEFAAVVADRLLAGDPAAARFDQELRVLDLLKRRFGEASLQGVDVMIRDVGDSRRVDGGIRRQQAQGGGGGVDEGMEYRARILSRLFWPALEREHFLLPAVVVEQQKRYEARYERLKSRRKLAWLNQMGMARVELELRDRTVTVDCSTVEATVVYAFQREGDGGADGDGDAPVERSVEELYEKLQMDEDLITAALQFWVGKGVLRRSGSSPSSYVVAETINEPTSAAAATDQPMDEEPEPAAAAGKQAMSPKERERRDMYWRYIQGMLTNASASMPLAQMAMMMKMLIADGFAWGNEELQDFLGEKVAAGEMEVVGGKYRLVKK
jgi:anaphase-promoting complex subunit 2